MTALAVRLLARSPLPWFAAMTWVCDQCHALNSDSSVTCYQCGA